MPNTGVADRQTPSSSKNMAMDSKRPLHGRSMKMTPAMRADQRPISPSTMITTMSPQASGPAMARPVWRTGQRYMDWRDAKPVVSCRRHGLVRLRGGEQWIRVDDGYLLATKDSGRIIRFSQHR